MIIQVLIALLAIPASTPTAAEARDEQQVVKLPVNYLTPIQAALQEFQEAHKNWRCFDIIVAPQSDDPQVLQIGFDSEPTVTTDPRSGTITVGPPTKCGPGASYLVRLDGTILQQIGHPRRRDH